MIFYILGVLALIFDIMINGITLRDFYLFGFLYLFLQLILAFKVKRVWVKLIPLMPIPLWGLLALEGYLERSIGGAVVTIFAIIVMCVSLFAVALAWLIFFIVYKIKTGKKAVTE